MITIIDEQGNETDLLAVLEKRNEEIKKSLEPILDEFLKEKTLNATLKKTDKLGYRFTKQIHLALSRYGQMSAEAVTKLDYDTLNAFWLSYLSLIAYYNVFFEIVDNKQTLMTYIGINSRIYTQLQKSQNEDIRNLMQLIEDSFVGMGFVATESGNASASAIKQRLGAKDVGHNVVSATDEMFAEKIGGETMTPDEIMRNIQSITGGTPKKLTGGK